VPETKVLELKQKYPDCKTRGRDPRVDKSIKRDITEGEKRQIREYLHIPSLTAITFEFGGGERPTLLSDRKDFCGDGNHMCHFLRQTSPEMASAFKASGTDKHHGRREN
jgi:hypothetical protein